MEDSMTKEEFTTVMQLIRMLIESSSSVEECLKKFDDLEVIKKLKSKE
ncbi:MAG: hypothetical protein IJU93_07175 [Lachnospiraceae bacterium]|nr:hypothetical protein [Lachnospiraceae bacterium]